MNFICQMELFSVADLNLSAYSKMLFSEQFTDNEKHAHVTTATAIENAAKQKVT